MAPRRRGRDRSRDSGSGYDEESAGASDYGSYTYSEYSEYSEVSRGRGRGGKEKKRGRGRGDGKVADRAKRRQRGKQKTASRSRRKRAAGKERRSGKDAKKKRRGDKEKEKEKDRDKKEKGKCPAAAQGKKGGKAKKEKKKAAKAQGSEDESSREEADKKLKRKKSKGGNDKAKVKKGKPKDESVSDGESAVAAEKRAPRARVTDSETEDEKARAKQRLAESKKETAPKSPAREIRRTAAPQTEANDETPEVGAALSLDGVLGKDSTDLPSVDISGKLLDSGSKPKPVAAATVDEQPSKKAQGQEATVVKNIRILADNFQVSIRPPARERLKPLDEASAFSKPEPPAPPPPEPAREPRILADDVIASLLESTPPPSSSAQPAAPPPPPTMPSAPEAAGLASVPEATSALALAAPAAPVAPESPAAAEPKRKRKSGWDDMGSAPPPSPGLVPPQPQLLPPGPPQVPPGPAGPGQPPPPPGFGLPGLSNPSIPPPPPPSTAGGLPARPPTMPGLGPSPQGLTAPGMPGQLFGGSGLQGLPRPGMPGQLLPGPGLTGGQLLPPPGAVEQPGPAVPGQRVPPPPPPPAVRPDAAFPAGLQGQGFSSGPPPPPAAAAAALADAVTADAVSSLIDTAAVQAAEQVAKAREAQLQREQALQQTPPTRTLKVPQQYVGFVIGPGGGNLQLIRESTGVTNIQIDQSTKEQGYSLAQVYGPRECTERAVWMIEAKIAEIDPTRTPEGTFDEVRIDQGIVGFMLGKGGETLKAIKQRSGAAIAIDQSTKDHGYSTMRIIGDSRAKALAKELVLAKMGEAKGPVQAAHAHEVRVEQNFVGWLIGKGGETVRMIKEQTGATVVIDQATKDMGYSTVKILPSPGAERAREMIEQKLAQVDALGVSVQEIPVDQHAVGLLIGRGGETVRQIKDISGATMVINQNTKDAGYSMVRLAGTPEAIAKAARLVARKLEEASTGLGPVHVSAAAAAAIGSGSQPSGSRSFGAVPPPSFGAVPPPNFGAEPSAPAPRSASPPKFGAVPPPSFGAVPPPSFGAVPPPSSTASAATGLFGWGGGKRGGTAAEYDPFAEEEASARRGEPKGSAYDPFASAS